MEPPGAAAELEGRLHPLALFVIARRFVGASLIPLFALLFSLGTKVLVPLLLAALLVGVPLAVLSWARFRYRVGAGRLELSSGVLCRNVRTIPLDRIRGVDVTAPFLHRLLGFVKVDVEAAAGGGSQAELSLAAVSHAQADALRHALLRSEPGAVRPSRCDGLALLHEATPALLALGGITSMRYLLAPVAILGVLFNLADDLPGGYVERTGDAAADHVPTHPLGVAVAGAVVFVLVLAIGAAGSLLVDWDFTLTDDGERLTASRGLLTGRVVTIDRARIRGADVRDTPLRRPLGLMSVTGIVAGLRGQRAGRPWRRFARPRRPPSAAGRRGAAPIPLLRCHRIRVGPRAPAGAGSRSAAAGCGRRDRLPRALGRRGCARPRRPRSPARSRPLPTTGPRFDGRRLVLREGSLRRRWSEVDPAAVVAFELRSSPGQRRSGLCTLIVHLGQGAGSRRALDAGEDQAAELLAGLHPTLLAPLLSSPEAVSPASTAFEGQRRRRRSPSPTPHSSSLSRRESD